MPAAVRWLVGSRRARAARWSTLIAALALAPCLDACAKKQPPPPLPVVYVSTPLPRSVVNWDDFVGRFVSEYAVDVLPRVSGYVQTIDFRDGQMAHKGQLLFVIDPRPYQAALTQAQGQEAHAVSALSDAKIELARAVKLLADKAISEQEYETRLATEQQAEADLVAAKGAVQTAALNLGFTRVTAPFSGRLSDHRVAPGALVVENQTVLTNITSLDPIWFTFDAAESYALKYELEAQTGQRPQSRTYPNPVDIRLQDQSNFVIHGHMDFVDNAEDPNSGTIRARAVVPNPNLTLTPGMFGHMRLLGSGSYRGLLLPDSAITTEQSDQIVYVVGRDGKVMERKITTGPLVDGLRVVQSGVAADELVVVNGLQRARPGALVDAKFSRIVPPNPGASPTPAELAPPSTVATFSTSSR